MNDYWNKVRLRKMTEGLSMEERANKLHESYRRFILQEVKK